ncbi:helix-turn-helix transcriptional regulator [Rhizocola hellebori]|nr:response regulator transcription factor [Rhizocola hellebori]
MSALLVAGQARVAMLWSNHGEALRFGGQAVASGVPLAVVQGRIAVGITQIKIGDIGAGLDQLRQARNDCAALADPDPDQLLVSYVNLACGLRLAGNLDEAIKVNLEGHELATVIGESRGRGDLMLANAAEAEFALGHWDRAHCLAGQITGRASDPIAVRAAQRLLGRIAIQRDPLSAHAALGAAADGVAAGHSRPASSVDTRIAQAELTMWAGDVAAARRLLISAWEAVCGTGEAAHSGHLLTLLARTGSHPQVCLAALPEQQAYASQCQAELTDDPDAWQEATQQWTALRRPYQAAYCGWRSAAALVAQATSWAGADAAVRRRVQEMLAIAAHQASALGARTLLNEIEAVARLHRLPISAPSAPAQAPAFGLTSRESEVLAWITAGWSNRQIGEKLFISPKTVSVHISNILRKLEVTSRYEAAAVVRHHGLPRNGSATGG